jgi:putative DNA methylase
MTYRKKLIEVAIPLHAINMACVEDKNRKTGHIRNIHKWFAPMPLPAWRAILFASLIDDPGEKLADDEAREERRKLFEVIEGILPLESNNV